MLMFIYFKSIHFAHTEKKHKSYSEENDNLFFHVYCAGKKLCENMNMQKSSIVRLHKCMSNYIYIYVISVKTLLKIRD